MTASGRVHLARHPRPARLRGDGASPSHPAADHPAGRRETSR